MWVYKHILCEPPGYPVKVSWNSSLSMEMQSWIEGTGEAGQPEGVEQRSRYEKQVMKQTLVGKNKGGEKEVTQRTNGAEFPINSYLCQRDFAKFCEVQHQITRTWVNLQAVS